MEDLKMAYNAIVVGCGISGAVVARYLAEQMNEKVLVIDRRSHIGGNMYDYKDEHGILVHQYGPHTFHTKKKELYDYMCKYADWEEYHLTCGAVINGKYTPTPFNFQTIDDFYEKDQASAIKQAIKEAYPDSEFATVLELLHHKNSLIREYAQFLFENDYSLYTAKQWGVSPKEIDPSVLKRVPIRFSYEVGYFDDAYQVMPKKSFTDFFKNILNHSNITVSLNTEAKTVINLKKESRKIMYNDHVFEGQVIYTGPLDELFDYKYGILPYRSLRFEWKSEQKSSFQDAPVVAYPQADDFTRITEYTKLPVQSADGWTTYAIEYSLPYKKGMKAEPYYPVLTEESKEIYQRYLKNVKEYTNLFLCGRLADFQYYNMDQALEKALQVCRAISIEN